MKKFFEWLQKEHGIVFAKYHKHTDECYEGLEYTEPAKLICGLDEETLYPISPDRYTKLLLAYSKSKRPKERCCQTCRSWWRFRKGCSKNLCGQSDSPNYVKATKPDELCVWWQIKTGISTS